MGGESSEKINEEYGLHNTEFQRHMATRTAQQQAAFLVPFLRSGMHVLDCGSGPGSITVDLANLVAPGQVVGIDISENEVERATALANERKVSNVRFETASVYNLPFADRIFDAVFSNAVFDHLSEPVEALCEMHSVLKPGGVAGIRAADQDGYIGFPPSPAAERYAEWVTQHKAMQGVSNKIGKQLRSLLRKAEFVRVTASASYDSFGTPERIRTLSNALAETVATSERAEQFVQLGWTDEAELEKIVTEIRAWAEDPDAFFAQSFVEAIGWRE